MKVSKEQVAANRARILEIASERFRERGFDGIGVADIMAEAGLTHGGFYGYFKSKEDLAAQACAKAIAESVQAVAAAAGKGDRPSLDKLLAAYLSPQHRDRLAQGCLLPALAAEIPRRDALVRHVFTEGLDAYIACLLRAIPGREGQRRRRRALATLSALVGAVVLARAVDDPALSEEILASTRKELAD